MEYWRRCSECKNPIARGITYWVCNVSTCNRERTGLVFCSVDCWDAHLPIARHRDAWAEERKSPAKGEVPNEAPKRLDMSAPKRVEETSSGTLDPAPQDEILVVASKVKAYIRARSGLNTSAGVMDALSDHIRRICDDAIRSAQRHERKTVLDRDVP